VVRQVVQQGADQEIINSSSSLMIITVRVPRRSVILKNSGVRQSGSSATRLCHGALIRMFLSLSTAQKVFVFVFLFPGIFLEFFLRHSWRFLPHRNQTDKEKLWQHNQRQFC